MTKAELYDFECQIVRQNENSIAVIDGSTEIHNGKVRDRWFWLPRSLIEIDLNGPGGKTIVTMPQWLAEDRGIV